MSKTTKETNLMAEQINTQQEYEKKITDTNEKILVDFYATWCGPCKMMSPVVEEVESDVKNKVKFYKIDIDEMSDLANDLHVSSIPTFVLYEGGKEIDRIIGGMPKQKLLEFVLA